MLNNNLDALIKFLEDALRRPLTAVERATVEKEFPLPSIKCRRCESKVGGVIAAQTLLRIVAFYEHLGVPPEIISRSVDQEGPLCSRCLPIWESGDWPARPATHQ